MNPIFVTGIQRSGSTIIAQILNVCGAFVGKTTEMYENIRIKNLVDQYYSDLSIPINGQFPLPDIKKIPIFDNWNLIINDSFNEQGYKDEVPCLYKSSRIIQTWPLWYDAFPNAKWVIVRRRTPDIINSCLKTAFMNAFDKKGNISVVKAENSWEAWLWWVHQHEKMFSEMSQVGVDYMEIWPERFNDGDFKQLFEIVDWCGLKWTNQVFTIANTKLWKSKQKGVKNGKG